MNTQDKYFFSTEDYSTYITYLPCEVAKGQISLKMRLFTREAKWDKNKFSTYQTNKKLDIFLPSFSTLKCHWLKIRLESKLTSRFYLILPKNADTATKIDTLSTACHIRH